MNALAKKIKLRKIIVFGTGTLSQKVCNVMPFDIAYYVDNNSNLWGKKNNNKVTKEPSVLLNEDKSQLAVIIASSYYADISNQLDKMGFEENVHYFNGLDFINFKCIRNKTNKSRLLEKIVEKMSAVKLYYLLKKDFDREIKAVFEGIRNNQKLSNFRRHIHMIEKGLIMKPRKEVFATEYIEDTLEFFHKLVTDRDSNSSTLYWAHSVLKEYFETVQLTYCLLELKKNFYDSSKNIKEAIIENSSPYNRGARSDSITIDEFLKLSEYRRSVRWFNNERVPHELIDMALRVATQSPSACNRMPYKYLIIENSELLRSVAELPGGIRGYQHNIPVLVVLIGDLSAYFNESDRHLIYIDSSLAAMSFIYALEIQGVSSCIINWPDVEGKEKKISALLNLKDYERPIMCIALGYEDKSERVPSSVKKNLNEIRRYYS